MTPRMTTPSRTILDWKAAGTASMPRVMLRGVTLTKWAGPSEKPCSWQKYGSHKLGNSVKANLAGHSAETANMHYGLRLNLLKYLNEESIDKFRKASRCWHKFLNARFSASNPIDENDVPNSIQGLGRERVRKAIFNDKKCPRIVNITQGAYI
ncbi:hypothetical protein RUND412_000824 [Rhizina undulata]